MKKLYYSPGMTVDELIDWNVGIGHITKREAAKIRAEERRLLKGVGTIRKRSGSRGLDV